MQGLRPKHTLRAYAHKERHEQRHESCTLMVHMRHRKTCAVYMSTAHCCTLHVDSRLLHIACAFRAHCMHIPFGAHCVHIACTFHSRCIHIPFTLHIDPRLLHIRYRTYRMHRTYRMYRTYRTHRTYRMYRTHRMCSRLVLHIRYRMYSRLLHPKLTHMTYRKVIKMTYRSCCM